MRLAKTLSLALVALIAALAVVGVSGAMAAPEHPEIILCESQELICEKPYPNPTEIHLVAWYPQFLTNLGTVECEKSLARLTLLNKLAALQEAHLLGLEFNECHLGETYCTITVETLGGLSLTPAESKLLANVESVELEGQTWRLTLKCGSFFNCTLGPGLETKLTAHSDEEGHLLLLANKAPMKKIKGFLCPKIEEWDAEYHAINLDEKLTLKTGLWIEL